MTDIQEIQLVDTAPHYVKSIVANESAIRRGKENASAVDRGGDFTPLFSKTANTSEEEDVVDRMQHEFDFLTRLKDSEVTPVPLLFKTNDDRTEGNLLTTKVRGKSLEGAAADGTISEISSDRADEVICAVMTSLDKIHSEGVIIRDVNFGTFVVDGMDSDSQPIKASVVDFEFAIGRDDVSDQAANFILSEGYVYSDIGYAIGKKSRTEPVSFEDAIKVERQMAIHAVLRAFLGGDKHVEFEDLTSVDQALYLMQCARVESGVRRYVHSGKDIGISKNVRMQTIDERVQKAMDHIMVNITLPYLLERKGITLSPETEDYICAALCPFLEDRPTHAINEEIPELEVAV